MFMISAHVGALAHSGLDAVDFWDDLATGMSRGTLTHVMFSDQKRSCHGARSDEHTQEHTHPPFADGTSHGR